MRFPRVLIVVVLAGTLPCPAVAEEGKQAPASVAEMSIGPTRVDWRPAVDAERWVLTVAGPGDFFLRQELEAGQAPFLSLFDQQGERLHDGAYTYELRGMPRVDPETREALERDRARGDETSFEQLSTTGRLPANPLFQSGSLTIQGGSFAPEPSEPRSPKEPSIRPITAAAHEIMDDLVVRGGACIDESCVASEATTGLIVKKGICSGNLCTPDDVFLGALTLKDIVVGIVFDDVPDGISPAHDWSIFANDFIGGGKYFAIRDRETWNIPFMIQANAPHEALHVRDNGNLGLGTSTPAQDVHAISGNSPALRLEQDGSGGLAARAWDVVGNETGFFVRDVTGSSKIPLRVRAGAPTGSVDVAGNGDVGVGTASPAQKLHLFEDVDANSIVVMENPNLGPSAASGLRAQSDTVYVTLVAHGSGRTLSRFGQVLGGWAELLLPNTGNGLILGTISGKPLILGTNNQNRLHITSAGSIGVGTSAPASLFHVNGGDVRVTGGSFVDDGVTLNAPDYVFEPGYSLRTLADLKAFIAREKHLPNVPSAAEIKANGLRLGQFQMLLLEKVEELTLYAIGQEEEIQRLRARNAGLQRDLEGRLSVLEQALGLAAAESRQ